MTTIRTASSTGDVRVQKQTDQDERTPPLGRFFDEVSHQLEDARRDQEREYSEFFSNLTHRISTARRVERELDRRLARRFNVLDYLQTDELGLSKIIADLLDPEATHGQGSIFLARFFSIFSLDFANSLSLDRSHISVEVEKEISEQRRIDVFVQIMEGESVHVLAIENKPFAGDQPRQVHDYLHYLRDRCGNQFSLIYLSPRGEGPSEESVALAELRSNWTERFRILSYAGVSEALRDDQFGQVRISQVSLVDWLRGCQRECDVDRLRWFLGDVADFCHREFWR